MTENARKPRHPGPSDVEEYKVGPGRPPREYQFQPGRSGNPKGRKRKPPSIGLDLKAALERTLNKKVKLTQGERTRVVTMAEAAIEQLVAQAVKGDPRARRDLIALTTRLGIDLTGTHKGMQQALSSNYAAILADYVSRQTERGSTGSPVIAPPELLDDDPPDEAKP